MGRKSFGAGFLTFHLGQIARRPERAMPLRRRRPKLIERTRHDANSALIVDSAAVLSQRQPYILYIEEGRRRHVKQSH
jgi:hypothetical protein